MNSIRNATLAAACLFAALAVSPVSAGQMPPTPPHGGMTQMPAQPPNPHGAMPPSDPHAGIPGMSAQPPSGGMPAWHNFQSATPAQGAFLSNLGQFDENGDGAISREEFDKAAAAMFRIVDLNGDGKLAAEERNADFSELTTDPAGRSRILMRRFDVNRDAKIEAGECLLPPKMFAAADANDDGAIDSTELAKLDLFVADVLLKPERRANVLLAELDKDKDGKIVADEWPYDDAVIAEVDTDKDKAMTLVEMKDLPPLPVDHPKRQAAEMMARLDEDKNGKITVSEFRRTRIPHDLVDKDKDGLIDMGEMTEWYRSGQARNTQIQSILQMVDQIMDRYDKNGDSTIDRDEVSHMPAQMFQRWDTNGDGKVTAREIEDSFLTTRAATPQPRMGPPMP